MTAIYLTDNNFDETVHSTKLPVLVDFWAPWCPPCRAMGPVVDELATDLDGQAIVAKVNIDEAPELARRYRVESIPAFAVIQDGDVKSQSLGASPKARLREQIEPFLQ